MNNEFNKGIDSLSEQKRKLEIALYYTHNDAEKGKKMISGIYKDLYAIKVKFSVSTTFGAFLMFFNIPYCSLIHSFVIITHSYVLEDIKTASSWRLFEEEMEKVNQTGNHDGEMISKMRDDLSSAFTVKIGVDQRANELKRNLEHNDEIAANRVIKKFIQDRFGFQNIDLSVDYEQISSLHMELYSITSNKIDLKDVPDEKENKKEEPEIELLQDDEDELKDKDVQLILPATLILSPIKGKGISSVKNGDRLKVNLVSSDSKAISVAKAFKAYENGKFSPITGRVVSIRHLVNGGYKIFCLIAKGIYVKVEEEEDNIKIAVDDLENMQSTETDSFKIPLIFIIAIVLIVLAGIVIAFFIF